MTTALTIVTSALQELGVLDPIDPADATDAIMCLAALNLLADSWLTEPNYAYTSSLVSASLAAGVQSLTIGTSQSINCTRPLRLEEGGYVRVGSVDYPLENITEAEYNSVPIKSLSGPWPSVCYYDTGFPTGNVFFWPTGPCTVYVNVRSRVTQFADLATSYTLPPGYERAFTLTLAEEVASKFRRPVSASTARNARQARRAIKQANFVVPQLTYGNEVVVGIPPVY